MDTTTIDITPLSPDALIRSITMRDVFPDAAFDAPLELPTEWTQPSRSRVVRLISQLLAPVPTPGESTPLNSAPAPGFWSVYARQRGLENGDPLWVRELPAAPLHSRASVDFTAVLTGQIGDFDVQLAACTSQKSRRSVAAHLIFGTRVDTDQPNSRSDPSREGQVGWVLNDGVFAAWLDIVPVTVRDTPREAQPQAKRRKRLAPLVDERLVDWFCTQAISLASTPPVASRTPALAIA